MDENPVSNGAAGPPGPRAPLELRRSTRALLDQAGAEFLADIFRRETRRNPTNVAALAELGMVYTSLGNLPEGLKADQALVALLPDDPTVNYNLACSYALLGQPEDALDSLEAALDFGYDDGVHMVQDEDLKSLHAHPRFQSLLRALSVPEDE
ncbi:MAG: tetratricopeptide (TPR) repeat protein [Planctomycetota bacterium]